jgi:hypothetical protein
MVDKEKKSEGPFIQMVDEKGKVISRKYINYSLRKAEIYNRHRAFEAAREAGIFSPMEMTGMIRSMKREEKIRCALMEAVKMHEREYEFEAILDHVELKYSKSVSGIREIVGEYLKRFILEDEKFGFLTLTEDAETEEIRRAILDAERERKEKDGA